MNNLLNERYIITDEDSKQYISDMFTETDVQCVVDGLITIIRLSDGKFMMDGSHDWQELPKWQSL